MTREEREEALETLKNEWGFEVISDDAQKALEMAIKALEQQPIYYPPCEDCHKKMDAIRNAYDKLQRPCDDCISRAELIDKTIKRNSIWLKITDSRGMNLQEIIDELPSVQPTAKENLVVGDCISRQAVLEWIKGSLEQYADTYSNDMLNMWLLFEEQIKAMPSAEPCEDCISRKDAINAIKRTVSTEQIKALKRLPSIQPKSKTGRWIEKDGFDGDTYYDCSECGESWTTIDGTPWNNGMKYCPNCGAKMESGDSE